MERFNRSVVEIEDKAIKYGIELLTKNVERIGDLFEIKFPKEYIDSAADQVANGSQIVLVANHLSHADVFPLALAAGALTIAINKKIETGQYFRQEPFLGFEVPMAASVITGGQGKIIPYFYDQITGWFKEHHIEFLPISRGKYTEENIGLASLKEFARNKQVITDTGLAIFPEGTVQGGRCILGTDSRHGIVHVATSTAMSDLALNSSHRQELTFVTIGISKSYDVFDPDTRKPTLAAIALLGQNLISRSPKHLAKVTMGKPFSKSGLSIPEYETMRAPVEAHQAVNNQVLKRISQLIPVEERGVYRST